MAQKKAEAALPAQDVARIRDILLGPYIRESEQRFQSTQRDVGRLQQLLDQLAEQAASQAETQAQELQAQADRLTKQLADLEGRFGKQLQQEVSTLDGKMADLGGRMDQQIAGVDTTLTKKLQGLQQDLRRAENDLRAELREMVEKLTDDKTDRRALGQMLIEIGNQLAEGGSAVGLDELLRGLASPEE
jgi:DNA repair exonuclease SbcCD ATPase subunit